MISGRILTGFALVAAFSGASAVGDEPQANVKWKVGAPIVTYWAGPGAHTPLNDETAAQLAAGGWNLGWAKTAEQLDLYDRHGLRVVLELGMPDLDDPAQAQALEALVERVRNHPALYAYSGAHPFGTRFEGPFFRR